MAVLFPDKIKSNNSAAYGIVDANEVAGIKSVATYRDLFDIPDSILKGDKTELECIGQLWNVAGSIYILIDYSLRKQQRGWKCLNFNTSNIIYIDIVDSVNSINTTDVIIPDIIVYDKSSNNLYAKKYNEYNKVYENWIGRNAIVGTGNNPNIYNIYSTIQLIGNNYVVTLFSYNPSGNNLIPISGDNDVIDKTTLDNILI